MLLPREGFKQQSAKFLNTLSNIHSPSAEKARGVHKESKNLSLCDLPGKFFYNKKERKSVWMTTLPMILRDLAPSSGFNPQNIWTESKEKLMMVGDKENINVLNIKELNINRDETDSEKINLNPSHQAHSDNVGRMIHDKKHSRSGCCKHKKKKGLTADEIRAGNKIAIKEKALDVDKQRLAFVAGHKGKLNEKQKKSITDELKTSTAKQRSLLNSLDEAVKRRDKYDAYDVLWALEERYSDLFTSTESSDSDNSDASNISDIDIENVKVVREWRRAEDIVCCQLKSMSDRLPPLSKYNNEFQLDEWQIKVLELIDCEKSVIISAPTSSGKTVISTYVASLGRKILKAGVNHSNSQKRSRVLFVVPTEPLVWQVAAHFSKHINDGSVALVTNQLTYSPHLNQREPPAVIVGTPLALESALTKIRGKYASMESFQRFDRSQLVGGFDHYDWVVYDEIHALDGDEGEALQRLIRLMNCKFLALSATIGNADQLCAWMETVRGEQLQNTTLIDVLDKSYVNNGHYEAEKMVTLMVHESRFINLQRHIWRGTFLEPLHPLSAVSHEFLINGGFREASLPMTSRDSIDMFDAMAKVFPCEVIADLHPHKYFEAYLDGKKRITLQLSKQYEDALKIKLSALSLSHPIETQALLSNYRLQDTSLEFDICELVLSLKEKCMTPCLLFHLNIFELITLFQQLVGGLEKRQHLKYPDHYIKSEALGKANKKVNADEPRKKGKVNLKEIEEEKQAGFRANDNEVPDNTQPHRDFSFLPNGPISIKEFDDICDDVKSRDKFEGDIKDHALMRALKRGIGLYINDHHFTAYRSAVMKLAMQGKLGVVLSDASLAYGVNMPFRTCVFCGEMGGQLDALIAQQMAGRSGRRGLDTQGHLVYTGARASFIQNLMLAKIPAITGKEPKYHTIFLQEMLSLYSNPVEYFPRQMQVLNQQSLSERITNCAVPDFRQESINILLKLNLIEECDKLSNLTLHKFPTEECIDFSALATPSGYKPRKVFDEAHASCAKLWMIWEMRNHVPESLLLGCLLPALFKEFVKDQKTDKESEDTVVKFCLYLILTCERQPFSAELVSRGHYSKKLSEHPFITSHHLEEKMRDWESNIANVQRQIEESGGYCLERMLLRREVREFNELDATLFDCIANKRHSASLTHDAKQFVKESITSLMIKLIHIHNNLMRDPVTESSSNPIKPGRYAQFEYITRTCFYRLQDISRDLIQDIVNFPNIYMFNSENRRCLKDMTHGDVDDHPS
jgi:hypothetical protein